MRLAQAILLCDSPQLLQETTVNGLPIVIEYPKGSIRELHNDDGKSVYKKRMVWSYGYIKGTRGRDGDEVDVLLGPLKNAPDAFIIHMLDKGPDADEREDEDKVMLGFSSANAARSAFHDHYPKHFFGSMSVLPVATFKQKLATASLKHHKRKIHATKGK